MTDLLSIESDIRLSGISMLCGVDEAGRGPLAGPVYAAAVILKAGWCPEDLDDSKKISEKKREALYKIIVNEAIGWGIGTASVEEIDRLNILNATYLAMNRAIKSMGITPELSLIDGNCVAGIEYPCRAVIGGDGLCASIAAASILAKVSRDRYMTALEHDYPQYGFSKHKGYGTKLHYEKLREHGISPVHRRSFLKSFSGAVV